MAAEFDPIKAGRATEPPKQAGAAASNPFDQFDDPAERGTARPKPAGAVAAGEFDPFKDGSSTEIPKQTGGAAVGDFNPDQWLKNRIDSEKKAVAAAKGVNELSELASDGNVEAAFRELQTDPDPHGRRGEWGAGGGFWG